MARQIRRFGGWLLALTALVGLGLLLAQPPKAARAATFTTPIWTFSATLECPCSCDCNRPSNTSPEGVNFISTALNEGFFVASMPGVRQDYVLALLYRGEVNGSSQLGYGVLAPWSWWMDVVDASTIDIGRPDGGIETWTKVGGVWGLSDCGIHATLTEPSTGIFERKSLDGTHVLRFGGQAKYVNTYAYSGSVLITRVDPLGGRIDYTYNGDDELTEMRRKETNTSSTSSSDIVESWTWSSHFVASHTDALGETTDFTRNSQGEVTRVDFPDVADPVSQTAYATRAYNAKGQPTEMVDEEGKKITLGGVSQASDGNGNLKDDGTYLYEYNYRSLLCRVKLKSDNSTVATYKHDALGRRVEKDLGTSRERYIYSGAETVSVYDSTNAWVRDFVFGQGIDEVLMLRQADVTDFDSDSDTSEVTRHFYHRNALGSVMLLTDMNEAEGASYRYDPYGAVTITVGGTPQSDDPLGNPFMFTARFQDEETGLMYYRARQYSPQMGMFLQRDSWGYSQGAKLYGYVRNRPTCCSDPSGHRDPDDPAYRDGGAAQSTNADRAAKRKAEDEAYAEKTRKREEAQAKPVKDALDEAIKTVKEHGPDWAKEALKEVEAIYFGPESMAPIGKPDYAVAYTPAEFGVLPWDDGTIWFDEAYVRRHCVNRGPIGRSELIRLLIHELRHVYLDFSLPEFWLGESHQEDDDPAAGVPEGNDAWTQQDRKDAAETMARARNAQGGK